MSFVPFQVALQALKRKKRYEAQLNQIDGTLTTLEYQREALENANTNTEVLKSMGFAAKAFKSAHLELDVDKVQDLKDDIAEQQELANEISNVISSPMGMDAQFDEDDLMKELEELEQEDLDKELLNIPSTATDSLPSVPTHSEPAAASKGEYCLYYPRTSHSQTINLVLHLISFQGNRRGERTQRAACLD